MVDRSDISARSSVSSLHANGVPQLTRGEAALDDTTNRQSWRLERKPVPQAAHLQGQRDSPEIQVRERLVTNCDEIDVTSDRQSAGQQLGDKRSVTQHNKLQVLHDWYWELSAWLLGTVALIVIIALLASFNGEFLSKWNSIISINTIVSVLSQAAVPALLVPVAACIGELKWLWYARRRRLADMDAFDLASRGPQGSLMYLCNVQRMRHITSLGAAITLMMLGFQPFVQQAVNTSGMRPFELNRDARISRASELSDGWFDVLNETKPDDPAVVGLWNAINTGLSSNTIDLSQVEGSCASGHCTWPPFTSLGFYWTVEDISSDIIADCSRTKIDKEEVVGFPYSCNITAKGMAAYDNSGLQFPQHTLSIAGGRGGPTKLNGTGPIDVVEIWMFYVPQSTVDQYPLQMYNFTRTEETDSREKPPTDVTIIKASIGLALQTLNSTFANGTTKTQLLSIDHNAEWAMSSTNTSQCIMRAVDDGRPFVVDFVSVYPLVQYLGINVFHGNKPSSAFYQSGQSKYYPKIDFEDTPSLAPVWLAMQMNTSDGISSTEGIEGLMGNLSVSLTNLLRTTPSIGGKDPAIGTAWTSASYIYVDFRWLAFPLVLWLLTTVFLFYTIQAVTRNNAPVWKSSTLALLQCSDNAGGPASERQAMQNAVEVDAQLIRASGKWRLRTFQDEKAQTAA